MGTSPFTHSPSPLRKAIEASGKTQTELARELKISETAVSRWVRGLRPNPQNRQRIARRLGVEPTEIWADHDA